MTRKKRPPVVASGVEVAEALLATQQPPSEAPPATADTPPPPSIETQDPPPEPPVVIIEATLPDAAPPPPPLSVADLKTSSTSAQLEASKRRKAEVGDEIKRRKELIQEYKNMAEVPTTITIVDKTMDSFIEVMQPNSSKGGAVNGAKEQLGFYRMLLVLLNKEGKELNDGITYLLGRMQEERVSTFNDISALRYIGQMRGTEAERDYARILMTLLISILDPRGKSVLLSRTDFTELQRVASLATDSDRGARMVTSLRNYIKRM